MKKAFILILVVITACSESNSEKYNLGFQEEFKKGFNKADSISKSSSSEKQKEEFGKGLQLGIKKGLLQADSIANSLPELSENEQFNLGFQRAFYLNNNLIKERLVLTDDEFWRLVAEVYYSVNDRNVSLKPISKSFESVSFLPKKHYRNIYRFRENLMQTYSTYRLARQKYNNRFRNNFFVPTDTIRIPNSNRYIVPMHGYGFESIPYVFSIFTIDNDKYSFNGILDSCFNTSIGSLNIKEILSIDRFNHILIGQSSGGDAGDHWGSLWIVPFNNFLKLGNKKAFTYSYNFGEDQVKLDYSVNKETNTFHVNTYTSKVLSGEREDYKYAEWEKTKSDTIKLAPFN